MAKESTLKTYRSRRDFRRSPEPDGNEHDTPRLKKDRNPIFVIQKHDASQLHYDLRLEIDGVLKSWAVPKGPSTDPSEKRLAVHVEDHPLKYADFEGNIEEGQYGAGTVIVWDAGPYRNIKKNDDGDPMSMTDAFKRGSLEVWLEGKKLRGGYALIHSRMGGSEKNWLLIKMKDTGADARRNPTSSEPRSVVSGRTIKEVADELEGPSRE